MYRKMLLALAVVALTVSGVVAEEVSQATLNDMGLSGMQTMSDHDGMAVRGTYARVGGYGLVRVYGTTQYTDFAAGDSGWGPDFAAGANVSIVASVSGGAANFGNGTSWWVGGRAVIAAGGAVAYAGR